MMLKIEDLKVGDELVCIDLKSMEKAWENTSDLWRKAKIDVLKISRINIEEGLVYFQDGKFYLERHELQYFKKKEEHTFNDLIDVAVQAVKDKVINGANIRLHEIGFMHNNTHYKLMPAFDCKEQIDLIKSLYKETFVIESMRDAERMSVGAMITLNNSEIVFYSGIDTNLIYVDSEDRDSIGLPFFVLKGATVEQSK